MGVFLETKRLVLKAPELSDFDNLAALRGNFEVMQYIGLKGEVQTKEQVKDFLNFYIDYQRRYGFGFCSVFEIKSGDFVGQAGLFHLGFCEDQPEIEIAYRLHKKFWGKGYATELTKALIQWGFTHLTVARLIAVTHAENVRSRRVLEKSGLDYVSDELYHGITVARYAIYRNDSIELVPYDSEWPILADIEIKRIRELLPSQHIIDIQHVGSTAIPGMLAKPIIDIQIAVDSLATIKKTAIEALNSFGYVYWEDNPDPERMFFAKGMPPFGERRTHHVHIVELSSKHWRGKIAFRNYLLSHPEAAHEYANLKKKLADLHTHDREQYTEAKTEFIAKILKKVGIIWKRDDEV